MEQAGGRRRYAFALLLAEFAISTAALAQARVIERHGADDPEGRLLGFYSAAMAFSPAGVVADRARLSLALEVSYVPQLNDAQRRPSLDKPEATNLAPAFPRPRLAARLPHGLRVEASWIPPVPLFDVKANLLGAALSRTLVSGSATELGARVWTSIGRVQGAMTCSESTLLGHGPDLETYFEKVCHGRESRDWFEPRLFGGDLLLSHALGPAFRVYLSLGARLDRTRFDIGVIRDDDSRDPDHPILALRTTRAQGAVGAMWRVRGGWSAGAEAFYAPGSLLTARLSLHRALVR